MCVPNLSSLPITTLISPINIIPPYMTVSYQVHYSDSLSWVKCSEWKYWTEYCISRAPNNYNKDPGFSLLEGNPNSTFFGCLVKVLVKDYSVGEALVKVLDS